MAVAARGCSGCSVVSPVSTVILTIIPADVKATSWHRFRARDVASLEVK